MCGMETTLELLGIEYTIIEGLKEYSSKKKS